MTPGIYYLYEYNADQKIRNIGFLKASQQQNSYILQLSARQIPVRHQKQASLSIFLFQNEQITEKSLASIPCQNHLISARLAISTEDFPDKLSFEEIDGFILRLSNGQIYAASAPGITFSADLLQRQEDIHIDPVEEESFPQPEAEFSSLEEIEEAEDLEDALSVSASACTPVSTYPKAQKLHRSELSALPKRFWQLANNSFLLHGYHNYHHLLLIEDEDQLWLGVPGIYTSREARAAGLFGFPQFTKDYTDFLDLSEEECEPTEDFGHWCRWLK